MRGRLDKGHSHHAEFTTPRHVERLRCLSYADFLRTRYWRAVRTFALLDVRACTACGFEPAVGRASLRLHHRTYDRHGLEHLYWRDDLVPVCDACHRALHRGTWEALAEGRGVPQPIGSALGALLRLLARGEGA